MPRYVIEITHTRKSYHLVEAQSEKAALAFANGDDAHDFGGNPSELVMPVICEQDEPWEATSADHLCPAWLSRYPGDVARAERLLAEHLGTRSPNTWDEDCGPDTCTTHGACEDCPNTTEEPRRFAVGDRVVWTDPEDIDDQPHVVHGVVTYANGDDEYALALDDGGEAEVPECEIRAESENDTTKEA